MARGLLTGRQKLGERKKETFSQKIALQIALGNCPDCFIETSTQQMGVRNRFLEEDKLVWGEKKEGYNLTYTYSKTRGGWFCPCCDCPGIARVKLWTHDV